MKSPGKSGPGLLTLLQVTLETQSPCGKGPAEAWTVLPPGAVDGGVCHPGSWKCLVLDCLVYMWVTTLFKEQCLSVGTMA